MVNLIEHGSEKHSSYIGIGITRRAFAQRVRRKHMWLYGNAPTPFLSDILRRRLLLDGQRKTQPRGAAGSDGKSACAA
jgi:hypothetical protein